MKYEFNSRDTATLRGRWDAFRHETGARQHVVAGRLGMTQSAFSKYLTGETALNLTFVIRLAEIMGLEPYHLVKGVNLQFRGHGHA